jgi:methylthioribose-1-phosphate isomerase
MTTKIEVSKVGAGHLPLKFESGRLLLVDQRLLPDSLEYFDGTQFERLCFAIKDMVVRGAPSIGVAAAFGYAMEASRRVLESKYSPTHTGEELVRLVADLNPDYRLHAGLLSNLQDVKTALEATRPTAVNLRWATNRMHSFCANLVVKQVTASQFINSTMNEANRIFDEHLTTNLALSTHGLAVIKAKAAIITHCNAGPLAVCGWGTALGVIRLAKLRGLDPTVYADETRPRNQGSKLTVWELMQDEIAVKLVCDNMSGFLMSQKKVDLVIVGADRIAANGDTANKIGTYNLAIVAQYHDVPFYVAAPLSTFDPDIADGSQIPIEERNQSEITMINGMSIAPCGTEAFNPAFDVTPAKLVSGIITEVGILKPPYLQSIRKALSNR